ncbi:MAG: hypothetical protein M1124_01635 [Candidatus Marsarchaeota archaeon]|jgi:hypothetical protein|nr:hypothetical protein [Candidatus Marsarchaeota archaeon]
MESEQNSKNNEESLESLNQLKINLSEQTKINQVYVSIILRYKDYIEEKERISVAELPRFVIPKNTRIQQKVEEFKSNFENYVYEKDFYYASLIAYDFVKNKISEINLPIEFWFYPNEILEFLIGDIIDKNILLCSLLIALGNPSAKVFTVINNSKQDIFTYYEFNGRVYKMDIKDEVLSFESKEKMLQTVLINNETTAYEFNNHVYNDIN